MIVFTIFSFLFNVLIAVMCNIVAGVVITDLVKNWSSFKELPNDARGSLVVLALVSAFLAFVFWAGVAVLWRGM